MRQTKPVLIVGLGLSGVTIARLLAEAGYLVVGIDKRGHVAGNAYDACNEVGIRVHHYGPHIFHTNNRKVFDFLSRFTQWTSYQHRVKALLSDGRLVTFPVNKETADIVGRENIVDIFYRPYTKKMWAMNIEDLDPEIISRVPIRSDFGDLYFPDDKYQFMPVHGYSELVKNILDHANISFHLNEQYDRKMDREFHHIFNSMSLDDFFGADMGLLPYRSIRFHTYTLPVPRIFPVATVNFTHDISFTRATEWKNFPYHGSCGHSTTVTIEEPCDFIDNNFERYYPVKDANGVNRQLYKTYRSVILP
jgi:UDP-galactopyranose mutase